MAQRAAAEQQRAEGKTLKRLAECLRSEAECLRSPEAEFSFVTMMDPNATSKPITKFES